MIYCFFNALIEIKHNLRQPMIYLGLILIQKWVKPSPKTILNKHSFQELKRVYFIPCKVERFSFENL